MSTPAPVDISKELPGSRSTQLHALLAERALAQIPKILTLQDRNPHSPTYGCFDRNFWHYKIIDFPSGMAAEFVWPLALAYALDIPGNPYYRLPVIAEWVQAGIIYAARSAHPDGSCDDYFPFEKAAGAAAFSLLASMEACDLLDVCNDEMRRFFSKRAEWLARHQESGRLTNHQALIVLCLQRAGELLGEARWTALAHRRLNRVLEWQDTEGWFQEYEGCDPGYHTLTIGLLAQLHATGFSEKLKPVIEKAVEFAAEFVHPDGSFGGEYTSRNTYNFFPHGFELAGKWMPIALDVNDRILAGFEQGKDPCYADDHIIGHHTWSYLLAWRYWTPRTENPVPVLRPPEGRRYFRNAGMVIDRRGDSSLYLALNKGGVFKLFRKGKLICSDTHLSLLTSKGGRSMNAVGHLVGDYHVEFLADSIRVSGRLGWAKAKQMTTFNLIVLRAIMYAGGRLYPDLVRRLLQKVLITGKKMAPYEFSREIRWEGESLRVIDELSAPSWADVDAVGIGASQTSIYVVMSRTYQAGQLQPWLDLKAKTQSLQDGESLRLERVL